MTFAQRFARRAAATPQAEAVGMDPAALLALLEGLFAFIQACKPAVTRSSRDMRKAAADEMGGFFNWKKSRPPVRVSAWLKKQGVKDEAERLRLWQAALVGAAATDAMESTDDADELDREPPADGSPSSSASWPGDGPTNVAGQPVTADREEAAETAGPVNAERIEETTPVEPTGYAGGE